MGLGPMTGRAAGYCAGYPVPGFTNPYGGRGLGLAWGRGGGWGMGLAWRRAGGRGWSFWPGGYAPTPYAPPTYGVPVWGAPSREDELKMLREQADWLKGQMESVNERIQELEKEQD
jgi:hypothetical protein